MELVELNSLNQTQHRERAIDVPESFVAIVKQTPRYPPPQKYLDRNDSNKDKLNYNNLSFTPNNQINLNNNKVGYEPEKLRKYSEEINKKKQAEEEFIRSSLRNSIRINYKNRLLKNDNINDADYKEVKNGIVNNGLETDDLLYNETSFFDIKTIIKKVCDESNNEIFSDLVKNTDLLNLVSIYKIVSENTHKIDSILNLPLISLVDLIRDIIFMLQSESTISSEAAELLKIITKLELDSLCGTFDKIFESKCVLNEFEIENQHNNKVLNSDRILYSNRINENIRIVCLKKSNCEPLGITIFNDIDGSVIIGRIVKGGTADKCGLLNEGDEIIEINGIELRGRSVNQICEMLAEINGTLNFIIGTKEASKANTIKNTQTFVHLRALFDYDPEEDIYIPCKELGICFNKGDILHVIDQSDQNWWQAYKEGDQEHSLAGLIPSIYFQIQKESIKNSLINDCDSGSYKKKNSLFCNGKRKKKKNVILELQDELLTYEEVHLYYPKANIKRPIVLIGPTNIGRHELRQRIMLDTERFAAAVPHTSRNRRDGEMDGVDYHFISRSEFELYIRQGKFVEHGQYEGNFYGTSLGAIEAVVQSGKICLLNLHVHSIHILRQSPAGAKLKPYFVFVAPPLQLDKLNKLISMTNHSIETGSLSSKDLQFIIEEAKEIESKYGHYFDMVLSMTDIDKAYYELLKEINTLERESQWILKVWIK